MILASNSRHTEWKGAWKNLLSTRQSDYGSQWPIHDDEQQGASPVQGQRVGLVPTQRCCNVLGMWRISEVVGIWPKTQVSWLNWQLIHYLSFVWLRLYFYYIFVAIEKCPSDEYSMVFSTTWRRLYRLHTHATPHTVVLSWVRCRLVGVTVRSQVDDAAMPSLWETVDAAWKSTRKIFDRLGLGHWLWLWMSR